MKKFMTAVFATAILATAPLAVSTNQAEAKCKGWKCALGKGVATGVGIGVGVAIVDRVTRPRQPDVVYVERPARPRYVAQGFSDAHYDYCARKYRSYDYRSNSYQPYSGGRRSCRSPY